MYRGHWEQWWNVTRSQGYTIIQSYPTRRSWTNAELILDQSRALNQVLIFVNSWFKILQDHLGQWLKFGGNSGRT